MPPQDGMDIDISDMTGPMPEPRLSMMEDGSVVVDFSGPEEPEAAKIPHNANLAEHLPKEVMDKISADLCAAVESDIESYAEWTETYLKGIKYLGFKPEEKTYPFKGACGIYDPLLAESVIRFQSMARGEMLPADGPVKTKIVGLPDEGSEQKAERVRVFMNLFLTELAPEYYEDTDTMLMWLPIVGSTFKKVYQDPILGRARSDFIPPDQFVVNYNTKSLSSCGRCTHILPMNGRDLIERQLSRFYRKIDIKPSNLVVETDARQEINFEIGLDPQSTQMQSTSFKVDENYNIYETHTNLDIPGFEHLDKEGKPSGLPLPYIVSIDKESKEVLSIYRNWEENDKRFRPVQYFVHFKFLPGLGFYGYGYAHVLGGNAVARTSLARQLVDSGTFANFPGGVRAKGARFENNNLNIGPGEFPEIETGGVPIDQVFKPLPYKEPSPGLFQMYTNLGQQFERMAGMTEIAVGEGRQDAPVGTITALLEAANRIQSAVMKRMHVSFRDEFRMFARLFGKYLAAKPYPIRVEGGNYAIMKSDFDGSIDVVPVSDPNITSSAQRLMRTEAMLRINMTTQPNMPEYQRNAVKMLYTQMGIDKPDMYLPPLPQAAQPMDPLSENMNAMRGMPVVAAPYQDHDAHIMAHSPLAEQNQMLAAHVQEHVALKYKQMIEAQIGQPLPEGKMPPQVENQIAIIVAKATQAVEAKKIEMAKQAGQIPSTPVVDVGFAAMQETAAKMEQAKMKMESEAQERQAKMFQALLESDDRARTDATKLKVAKINAVTKLETDDSSKNKPVPPEVR
jgi:hypothetical protein